MTIVHFGFFSANRVNGVSTYVTSLAKKLVQSLRNKEWVKEAKEGLKNMFDTHFDIETNTKKLFDVYGK